MFNKQSLRKNSYMLNGKYKKKGYDWWWHSFTAIDKDNNEVPFFVEFFIINPELSKDKVVLGQSLENKGKNRPSYLMIKCGCWGKNKTQLHRFIPLSEVVINRLPITIKAHDCFLSEDTLRGSVYVDKPLDGMMCDKGEMSFDLKIEKKIAFNVGYGTSKLFCDLKAFEMYWHAQGMKSLYSGEIVLNGERYIVKKESSYGYQDKNWGSNFTTPWLWLSSNHLYSRKENKWLDNSVYDIGGGKPKAFGITFNKKLLGAYYIEGKEYEYNFSKFLHPSKTSFTVEVTGTEVIWNVIQNNRKTKIETAITCKLEDMLFVNYEAPSGLKQHNKLYNGGNGIGTVTISNNIKGKWVVEDVLDTLNVGCEYGEFTE